MAVFRVHKTSDFTVMSNCHLRDKSLSLKAKGLLSVILSLPDDWSYSIAGLAAICKEGTSAVKSAIDELASAGYVTVTKLYPNETCSGRIEYVYDIHERPQGTEKQGVENLPLEKQGVENRAQLNTDESSTYEQSTDKGVPYAEIVGHLNEVTGSRYKSTTEATRSRIRARWAEGFRLEDFERVIDTMAAEWGDDPKMSGYLRPETLFGTKFEGYLNRKRVTRIGEGWDEEEGWLNE